MRPKSKLARQIARESFATNTGHFRLLSFALACDKHGVFCPEPQAEDARSRTTLALFIARNGEHRDALQTL